MVKWIIRKLILPVLVLPPWSGVLLILLPIVQVKRRVRRLLRVKPRIIWGPVPIISIKYVSRSVSLYGYRTTTVVYGVYSINKKEDFDWVVPRNPAMLGLLMPYIIALWAIWSFDIFHFFFDGGYLRPTPLRWLELPILKVCGKYIVVSHYGSDVIMPSRVKNKYKWNVALEIERHYPSIDEYAVEKQIRYSCRYADFIFNDGQGADFIPKAHMSLKLIPIDLQQWKPVDQTGNERPVIVHAPNHRALKGTRYLIKACEQLKEEGYNFELVIVEGQPNEVARQIYSKADIIADQFLAGFYGLFAIEGMALGKPVLCYMRPEWVEFHGGYFHECPILSTNLDNLKENLRMLLDDPALRVELGKRGRKYVEKYHSYEFIGKQLDTVYRSLWFGESRVKKF